MAAAMSSWNPSELYKDRGGKDKESAVPPAPKIPDVDREGFMNLGFSEPMLIPGFIDTCNGDPTCLATKERDALLQESAF